MPGWIRTWLIFRGLSFTTGNRRSPNDAGSSGWFLTVNAGRISISFHVQRWFDRSLAFRRWARRERLARLAELQGLTEQHAEDWFKHEDDRGDIAGPVPADIHMED